MTEELAGGAAAPAEVVSTPEVQSNTPTPITESTPRFFFVHNETPAIATGKVVIGWTRLTSGAGHVANTDWAALYATNS